jgi:hypothetical protein
MIDIIMEKAADAFNLNCLQTTGTVFFIDAAIELAHTK